MPPCLGLVSAAAGGPKPTSATITAKSLARRPRRRANGNTAATSTALPNLSLLPEFELAEQLVLLLLRHGRPADGLLALVNKAREDRFEILRIGRGGELRIALQPLLGGRKAPPAGKLGRDIDLAPFGMMPGIEQGLKPGEKRIHEVHEVAVAVGSDLEIGGREHRADRNRVDGLIPGHETRVIGDGEPCRHIGGGYRRFERNGEEVKAVLAGDVAEERSRLPGNE